MCKTLNDLHKKTPDYFLKNIDTFPVDVAKILRDNHIIVFPVSFVELEKQLHFKEDSILGISYARGKELGIMYSENSSETQKRFTLAHELGHCCLHMNAGSLYHIEMHIKSDVLENQRKPIETIDSKKEEEADSFARDLLIPNSVLLWSLENNYQQSIAQLASKFDVPEDQMLKKLREIEV